MATTSKEINLSQLSQELGGEGLIADFNDLTNKLILPAEGVDLSDEELQLAIHNHIAKPIQNAKLEVLTKLGLTEDEAKLLLA
jgi:hypothetical protein